MQSRYNVINLKDFYLPNREFSISESDLTDFLASFSSPLNQDIEQFLHRTAVESSKKGNPLPISLSITNTNIWQATSRYHLEQSVYRLLRLVNPWAGSYHA